MANFNLPNEAIQVFWDVFGSNAKLDVGQGFKSIRLIDMKLVGATEFKSLVDGQSMFMMPHCDVLLRPQDMTGVEVGSKVKKADGITYYVSEPNVNLVGIGEVVLTQFDPNA